MKGLKDLIIGIRAGYSYFYVKTWEVGNGVEVIQAEIENYKNGNDQQVYESVVWDFADNPDPEEVFNLLQQTRPKTVIIAKNFNWFLSDQMEFNKDFVSRLQKQQELYSSTEYRKVLLIVSNQSFEKAIPEPLQKDFICLDMELPNEVEREEILDYIIESIKENDLSGQFKEPDEKIRKQIILNSAGLTRAGVEKALAYSVIKDNKIINPESIFELRKAEVEKVAGVKVGKYSQKLSDLLGMDNAKDLIMSIINHPSAKGFILVGPPGTGKTHFIKAIASELGKIVFEAELANMMGSGLVGQAENAVKEFCDLIRANPGCVVIFDEVEKGLPKKNNFGGSDVAERSMSQILKLLSDRPVPFIAFATSNNITSLPPEWLRAGRWDTAPICIDLPNEQERVQILEYYKTMYKVSGSLDSHEGWSGAELKEVCELAMKSGRTLDQVQKWIVPISMTMKEDIDAFRTWAKGRTIPASNPINTNQQDKKKRSIQL